MAVDTAPRYRTLADYLERSGDTQQGLARALNITQAQVSRFASGQAIPRAELAVRIATYCHIPVDSFTHAYLAYHAPRKRGVA